jgi:hypothetical protein
MSTSRPPANRESQPVTRCDQTEKEDEHRKPEDECYQYQDSSPSAWRPTHRTGKRSETKPLSFAVERAWVDAQDVGSFFEARALAHNATNVFGLEVLQSNHPSDLD